MKIDPHLLKFPKSLPNDDYHFMTYYPYKFPKVIEHYEKLAEELHKDPEAYEKFVHDGFFELEKAVKKVQEAYEKGNKDDLEFLIETDQKFNKVFCFKFWIINYVFADGPIHEFYVDKLKAFARKMVDTTDDVEEYEQRVISITRDLLQTDYADIYLVQALHGVVVIDFFEKDEFSKKIIGKIIPIIDRHDDKNNEEIIELWKPVVDRILDQEDDHYKELTDYKEKLDSFLLLDLPPLELPINQVRMRKTSFPLYSFLNHALEFREQNRKLQDRYENMQKTIEAIFEEAKHKFSEEEYGDFKLSYAMARNFSMSKDIMGNVDPIIVPVWEGDVHKRIYNILSKDQKVRYSTYNYASVFKSFVWYLPDPLKSKVMSVDNTPFSLEEL